MDKILIGHKSVLDHSKMKYSNLIGRLQGSNFCRSLVFSINPRHNVAKTCIVAKGIIFTLCFKTIFERAIA